MPLLEEYEQRQSGVLAILARLQELRENAKARCAYRQDADPVLDAYKTQWHRSQFAILKNVLDEIQEQGDTGEDAEGIGEAALPPSQQ